MIQQPRKSLTEDDLEKQLDDQLYFIKNSINNFDQGFTQEAKRLATHLRVLLYDNARSHSLLSLLNKLSGKFISTIIPFKEENLSTYAGLVSVCISNDGKQNYLALLDETIYKRWLPFDDWWTETAFVDKYRRKLSRKELVTMAANQDGGAHVDPKLDEVYYDLSKENSLDWHVVNGNGQEPQIIQEPERMAIRQIAHEMLITLCPDYHMSPNQEGKLIITHPELVKGTKPLPLPPKEKIGRNDRCPCGSGYKYKKCHGFY